MKSWIIYKKSANEVKPESYEINRFKEAAAVESIDLRILKPEQFDLIVTRDDRKSVIVDGKSMELPDFILPRMGAGTTYFALAVIRHLEKLGVYSVNNAKAIDDVKDKLYTHQILAQNGLPVPKTMLAKYPVDSGLVEQQIGFPLIVKTLSGSQGSGIYLIEKKAQFVDLMDFIHASKGDATNIILQEFVKKSKGRDLRVFVIGGRAVACMERIAKQGDYKANFSRGGEIRNFKITRDIQWLATETSRILDLDVAGIDLLFDGRHFKICEANSSPGFEGIEKCCEIDVPKEIFKFIRVRFNLFEE